MLATGAPIHLPAGKHIPDGRISGDGHLTALDSTFHGPVALNDQAVLQLTRSTVYGSITSNLSSLQLTVLHSHVHGDIFGQGRPDGASAQTVRDTIVDGDLNWGSRSTDHLFVTGDQVGGNLVTTQTDAVIQDTTVDLGLVSLGDQGLQVCNVDATGEVIVNGYAGPHPAYLGAYADPNTTCSQPVIAGEVDITGSKSPVYLGNMIILGSLFCTGNKVVPTVSSQVVVMGLRQGQCR